MESKNLLLVAGSGRNSGKTTTVCKIIEQFRDLEITSVKISPHFHSPSDGLVAYSGKPGYEVYEETNRDSLKDSSRMLQSGAKKVYYIQTIEERINQAFLDVYLSIPTDRPVVCESPSLINYIEPGLFIIMISPSGNNLKKIENLKRFPHIEFTYDEIINGNPLPISFENGIWQSLKQT
jgi:hypothetical protein